MKTDIWFKRVLWSYVPCNAKGWSFTILLVALVLCGVGVVYRFTDDGPLRDVLDVAVLGAVFLLGWSISERHA